MKRWDAFDAMALVVVLGLIVAIERLVRSAHQLIEHVP